MTAPLHFESLVPSIFETTVNAFKSGAKDIANNLLMNLIFTLKQQNNDLKNILFDLEKEPSKAIDLDTDDFQDSLIDLEDMLERLVFISEKYSKNSDIFFEFYKISNEMYSNIIVLGNEVAAIASELKYEKNKIAS